MRAAQRMIERALAAAAVAASCAVAPAAAAAELVMFMSQGCPWCAQWEDEVGRLYPRTEEARAYPLRRVDLARPAPGDAALAASVRYTPTFVLLACGREFGRITGYPGEAHFWGLLGEAIRRQQGSGDDGTSRRC